VHLQRRRQWTRQAIRYVERLVAAGADEFLFLVQMGTVPHRPTMETIRNIGTHLILHFEAKLATAAAEQGALPSCRQSGEGWTIQMTLSRSNTVYRRASPGRLIVRLSKQ
jgi:hypothetical protein